MTNEINATVVGGMLRPDVILQLPEHTRVRLTVQPLVETLDPVAAWESLKARLRERPLQGSASRYTRDELHERR
jgi:hypothetical protein